MCTIFYRYPCSSVIVYLSRRKYIIIGINWYGYAPSFNVKSISPLCAKCGSCVISIRV
nr:MAG TPA: protein of unknown function (DUF5553) [Caudoviricetes sp.]